MSDIDKIINDIRKLIANTDIEDINNIIKLLKVIDILKEVKENE